MNSKYQPLTDYLAKRGGREVRMTFKEIEKVIGLPLPPSKLQRAWWSNNPSNNVMTKAWLAAGFETQQVDVPGEKLVFVSNFKAGNESVQVHAPPAEGVKRPYRHPAWGALKGTFTLLPDVDLTEPADPDWGKVYEK